ncbi:MAG TPA: hypothetical protein VEZ12_19405, partial [Herpetosiphonaceae bacterium]|nr:hypothetical protein [Herpetosiphonaceae bacterium]
MSTAAVALPRVIHAVPGRMRVHLPGWLGAGPRDIEVRLRQLHGVRSAQANPVTGNVLIRFDPATTDDRAILGAVHTLETDTTGGRKYAAPPPALHERNGAIGRARIAVRGLDRDPDLARRVEETLECRPSVRARANVLTGRVLVQFDERLTALEELIADVAGLELLPLPGEDRPSHPLDPGPLIRSGSRIIGALLGLGLLGARQVAGFQGPPVSGPGPAETAAVIGILEGFPVVRSGLGALIGRSTVDLLFGAAGIVTLTLSGAPLGLTVVGLRALRVWTDVRARQAAFLRYEEHLGEAAIAIPGSVVRLEAGARTPLAAHVVEGHGMAIERDGLPVPLNPGSTTTAGACLQGGPFVLELYGDAPFVPQSRPAPIAPSLYDHYVRTADLGSLGYALVLGLITRSFAHGFIGLLLVNPRTAIIGSEAADRGASARVLRAGTVVVGTRPERPVRLPQVLLVDGPRVVTEGLEIGGVVPLAAGYEQSDVLARATAVAVAAGVTWSGAFRSTGRTPARQGSCDGLRATAYLNGMRYVLEPLGVPTAPPTARAADWPGDYLLVLRCDREVQPLGLVALRPKLAPGVDELVHAWGEFRTESNKAERLHL